MIRLLLQNLRENPLCQARLQNIIEPHLSTASETDFPDTVRRDADLGGPPTCPAGSLKNRTIRC